MATRRKKTAKSKAGASRKSSGSAARPVLILGEDTYLREHHREELLQAYLAAEERELGVERVDLSESPLGEVLGRISTPALFVQKQAVVISRLERIREGDIDSLAACLESPPEHALLIFEADKLDKRTRAAKLLLDHCEVREADRPEDDAVAVAAVEKFAGELGTSFSREALEDIVFAVGCDLGLLRRETEKLAAYTADKSRIDSADVAAVVSHARQFAVFEMADHLASGERGPALMQLQRLLAQGESPVGVVGALAYVFRQLMRARSLSPSAPAWEAAKRLRMQGPRAQAMVRQSHRFSRAALRRGLGLLLEADVQLKSSAPDPEAVLETLLVDLSQTGAAGTPQRR